MTLEESEFKVPIDGCIIKLTASHPFKRMVFPLDSISNSKFLTGRAQITFWILKGMKASGQGHLRPLHATPGFDIMGQKGQVRFKTCSQVEWKSRIWRVGRISQILTFANFPRIIQLYWNHWKLNPVQLQDRWKYKPHTTFKHGVSVSVELLGFSVS